MAIRTILISFFATLAGVGSTFAAGLPQHAPTLTPEGFPFPISNSMVMVWMAAAIIILFAQVATRKMALVPTGLQNFAEWLVESLYNFLKGILGEHLVKRTFWFFGTIFILILVNNWIGLLPGVGTVGWDAHGHEHVSHPLMRGGNADLNMTLAMSLTFAVLWLYWAITENGVKGFFAHIFAPKGKFGGPMKIMMILVFGMVGLIEVASIALRPVALSFRLYGNIFAGENLLEGMMMLGLPNWLMWLPPLPFYFLELLVGVIQALVFMLLTAVFLKLICEHDDHDEDHAH
ncbi:F0F1 ATP synthase subunit A [Persicirhabdus sediminis]|uniref:ATP synthase subunit a n=1 Tax=Persicirhabdus sediminis TaxID=454144 RepID=A0A8J7MG64_9BACT|nr:F0F1 ATP synthase subunit A [Persicirhabdus sediminis]MBK1792232.1 F0F1 ATP synthase subunit A [Persicirhabdus sediminis]